MLATYCRRHYQGNPKGAAAHKYRELTGNWPNRFDFNTQPQVEPSPALLGKLKSMEIAYRMRRRG